MGEFSRRDMLGAAAAGGMVEATSTETLGQGQPPFGPTPAPLAGSELPSFRFQLGAVAPKTWDGGWAKEATVTQFPVSQALAGVLMSLVPGGLRELHWHANAAEWAYVVPQTQAAIFTRHVRYRAPLARAIDAPRWLLGRTWGATHGNLRMEARFDGALVDRLLSAGHDVEMLAQPYSDVMGHAGAVMLHPDGTCEGGHDPRADGGAAGA